jgi:integrase
VKGAMMTHTDTAIEILDTEPGAITIQPCDHGMSWGAILNAWSEELQQRTGSKRTPVEYRRYAKHMQAILEARGVELQNATPRDVLAFAYARLPDARRNGEPGKPPGPAAVNVRLAAIRSLFDFLRRMGYVQENPATSDRVKRPALPTPEPRGLTPEQVNALMAAPPDTADGMMIRAAILTFVLTGIRRSELLALTAADLTIDDGIPTYRVRVKGGKIRRRELPLPAYRAILEYLEAAGTPLEALPDDARVFAISSTGLYEAIRRYGEQIGIDDLAIHSLRHTAAKLRRRAGASLEDVQELLGHSSIATTARYLAQLETAADPGWQAAMSILDTAGKGTANE